MESSDYAGRGRFEQDGKHASMRPAALRRSRRECNPGAVAACDLKHRPSIQCISDLQPADIEQIVTDAALEDEQLEFKRELPTKDGKANSWYQKQDQIGDRARNELLEEVVAFANAYGGDLILGFGETSAKPPRASSKHPVPACADLAHRLELAARDCIEPPLPRLEVRGVPTDPGGAGYVIMRTTKSAVGPHRLKPTLGCYRRSAARSQKMTMREIQDDTLAMARAFDEVDAKFESTRQRFAGHMARPLAAGARNRLGLRVTALPGQGGVGLSKVHNVLEVRPVTGYWALRGSHIGQQRLGFPAYDPQWRLVLRGTDRR